MQKHNRAFNDAQKFSLVKREAIYTGLALVGLILFWLVAGFGTSAVDVKIFHLPLWALLGTVGVWFVGIAIAALLSRKLFTDMDLGGSHFESGGTVGVTRDASTNSAVRQTKLSDATTGGDDNER